MVARGRVSVYEPKGEYQIVCEHMEPQGLGALQLAFDQLKKRLQDEGLFDAGRKRPLPALPRKIGIVTSLDGAAIRDIIKVLRRRYANAHLVIRPARVQGEGAALEIARGLHAIGRVPGVDVVIVGRGGGSIEDLWAFNEEIVARAIAASPVPVISAVGHETDVTIADFVADLRAPTPSAAAELVVAAQGRVLRAHRSAARSAGRRGARARPGPQPARAHAERPAGAGRLSGPRRDERPARRRADAHARARDACNARRARPPRLQQVRRQLATFDLGRRLAGIRTRLVTAEAAQPAPSPPSAPGPIARLRDGAGRLDTLSPLAVLGRGYAVCWNADRTRVLRDASATATGERVRVTLAKGELDCEVTTLSTTTEDTEANG